MKRKHHEAAGLRARLVRSMMIAAAILGAHSLGGGGAWARERAGACSPTARDALKACRLGAQADYWLALGKCRNLPSAGETGACRKEARAILREALEECGDQLDARLDLCDELGEAPHAPEIDPDRFVRRVTNPFFPLVPGTTHIYEAETEDGLERIEVEVTDETKTILGVRCVEVRDTVTLDDEVVEDTLDWFAQDEDGNVWYFGEHSEEFEDGVLLGTEGSWEAGVDGAQPGIIMKAEPEVGDIYRQEFLLGEAEDAGQVIALDQTVTVPFGRFTGCVQTRDFSPLEPDVEEHKFYAPGVGLVLEVDLESGQLVELIDVDTE